MRRAAAEVGCSYPTVVRIVRGKQGTHSAGGPVAFGATPARVLPIDHPATAARRTLFPGTVLDVRDDEWILKSGVNSAKIGKVVTKGPWKGFPVYTLTLEERATCPTTCRHWGSCFGNHMQFAKRWRHGERLEWRLRREVAALELDNPRGFALRVHSLGDFYSVGYVRMWRELLEAHPALHVFGYTARTETSDDEIAYEIFLLVRDYWMRLDPPRFAVRFSNAPIAAWSTATIESPVQKPRGAVICPAQWTPSGKKAETCATCGLCWRTSRKILFLQH